MHNDYSPPEARIEPPPREPMRVLPSIVAMISAAIVLFGLLVLLMSRSARGVLDMNPAGLGTVLIAVAVTGALVLPLQKIPLWLATILGPTVAIFLVIAFAFLVSSSQLISG